MGTLGGYALSKFDVYYDIGSAAPEPEIRSYVRFEGALGGGWLNARGIIRALDSPMEVPNLGSRPASQVEFTDFWIDAGSAQPRKLPDDVDGSWSRLAALFFFPELSRFPTLVFDREGGLALFRFPPLNVEIAAARVGV